MNGFRDRGWARFAAEPGLAAWAAHARVAARTAVRDPGLAQWHQCEGTWFVGVDALDNASDGAVAGSGPLQGAVTDFIAANIAPVTALHRAQISVIYPGYPRPRSGESAAGFRYRRDRDAAHVDGVLAVGPARRRKVHEPHSFVLGLPLTEASPEAAPMVVWEGSHHIMRRAFAAAFAGHDPANWADLDVTQVYQAARRTVFETCPRVPVHAVPGEAYVMDRLALHGVAPWGAQAQAGPDGRMIAYFRPPMPGGVARWLDEPAV